MAQAEGQTPFVHMMRITALAVLCGATLQRETRSFITEETRTLDFLCCLTPPGWRMNGHRMKGVARPTARSSIHFTH